MLRTFIFFVLLLLSSCARSVLLVQPTTGQVTECSASAVGPIIGTARVTASIHSCVEEHKRLGFIEADKLTPEQKAKFNIPQ
ncbi:MAG: hypothetical protein HY695_23820 [Deltaproteobacteria bacterium]|nr:hypothetical protein [Deltaproteobacteria bacterium]